jgi:diaminohydroxyphosphoribosylaminopyrimidine deaminase / 5-amino-6-(5-phosphoribosylamino)uracil reductase
MRTDKNVCPTGVVQQTIATVESIESDWTETDRRLMQRALELASKGVGLVSPGPLVGCVISGTTGEVLGEGFYSYDELKHAETYALEQAGNRARGATAYVSLEPHAHHGRTPPCTDALITAGVRRVLAPIQDPNPKVSGKGFEHLRSAGIEVSVGLFAREAAATNEKYVHYIRTGRPFVHLKLAASLDGKIATRTGDSRWITGRESRAQVHELRHAYDAILVGAGTARTDDPLLTDRSGKKRRLPLLRVLLDDSLSLSTESQLVKTARDAPLLVFASDPSNAKTETLASYGVEVAGCVDLPLVLDELGKRQIQSVLVEGGSNVAGSFLDAGLVNKVSVFIAPTIIGGQDAPSTIGGVGVESLAQAFDLQDLEIRTRGRDLEVTGYPRRRNES